MLLHLRRALSRRPPSLPLPLPSLRCLNSGAGGNNGDDDDDLAAELGLRRRSMGKALLGKQPLRRDGAMEKVQVIEDPTESGPVARMATAPLRAHSALEASEKLTELYESKARVMFRDCPGFIGAVLLFDGPRRNARSITMWDCKADMDAASERPEYPETMRALAEHFADSPDVETWRLGARIGFDSTPVNANAQLDVAPYKNAILVTGDTRLVKDALKSIGGSWNTKLNGWIFPSSRQDVVVDLLRKDRTNTVTVHAADPLQEPAQQENKPPGAAPE